MKCIVKARKQPVDHVTLRVGCKFLHFKFSDVCTIVDVAPTFGQK